LRFHLVPARNNALPPILCRALRLLWLLTGNEDVGMLLRLDKGDPSIPRIRRDRAVIFADRLVSNPFSYCQPAVTSGGQ
jgi:hypothetical protein